MHLVSERTIHEVDTAISLMNTGRSAEAADLFTGILIRDEKAALAWCNRGLALLQMGGTFDAILNIKQALLLEPNSAEFHTNLGAAYFQQEEIDKSIDCFHTAIKLQPKLSQAHMNLGNSLKFKGNLKEALTYYRNSVECAPDYVDAHINRAMAELAAGNYEEGWREFEWRWKSEQLPPRGLPIKEWRGESLHGKTILVYAEQGFGDALQFVRYAPVLKQVHLDCKVLVEVRAPLVRLIKAMDNIDGVISFGDLVPCEEIDYAVAMLSLPGLLGTRMDTIPWSGPYLKSSPFRASMWKTNLDLLPPGLKVGICWAGQSRPGRPTCEIVDRRRSTTLASFAAAAKVPGISWVSLQKGIPRGQVEKPPAGMTIGDWSDDLDDFYDTAALIDQLDLVISVDTAVVHLAAALGKPTWLLSRWDGCWRWLGDRQDSPWYPTLRQFTQPAPDDWPACMEQVAMALRLLLKSKGMLKEEPGPQVTFYSGTKQVTG